MFFFPLLFACARIISWLYALVVFDAVKPQLLGLGGGEGLVCKVLAVQVGSPEFRFPEPKRKLLSVTLPVIPALKTRDSQGKLAG